MNFLLLVESIKTTTVTPLQQRHTQSDPTRGRVESEIYPSATVPAPYTPLDTTTPREKVAEDGQHIQTKSNNPPMIASTMSGDKPTDSTPPIAAETETEDGKFSMITPANTRKRRDNNRKFDKTANKVPSFSRGNAHANSRLENEQHYNECSSTLHTSVELETDGRMEAPSVTETEEESLMRTASPAPTIVDAGCETPPEPASPQNNLLGPPDLVTDPDAGRARQASGHGSVSGSSTGGIRTALKIFNFDDSMRKRKNSLWEEEKERRDSDRKSTLDSLRGIESADQEPSGPDLNPGGDAFNSAADPSASDPNSPYLTSEDREGGGQTPATPSEPGPDAAKHIPGGKGLGKQGDKGKKRSLPDPSQKSLPKGKTEGGAEVGDGGKKRKKKQKQKKRTRPAVVYHAEEEQETTGPLPSPAEVFKKAEPRFSLIVTKEGEGSGAVDSVAQGLLLIDGDIDLSAIHPRPDGAVIETADDSSADAVQARMCLLGWTVTVNPIWARYEMTVPSQLAGTSPSSTGLDPTTLVRGLMLRNARHGLPSGALRYVSHTWERVNAIKGGICAEGSAGAERWRLRIWVDVSPEGEVFLREHGFLLETLVAAIRLWRAPRSRQAPDKS